MMAPKSISPNARPKICARARLQSDKVTGKPVLLYPEGALMLNPTGHAIVLLCDGNAALSDIVATLSARYGIAAGQVSDQVSEFLIRLRARNLLDLTLEGKHP